MSNPGRENEAAMTQDPLLQRVIFDPNVCGGTACIRGTRISVSSLLDAFAEGRSPAQIVDHYPSLTVDDVRSAVAYAAELAREGIWKVAAGPRD